jgi:ketosteroid isomerase-like protein
MLPAALLAWSAPVCAAELPADLAEAARAFDAAQVAGDGAALGRLVADDYLLVNSHGETETKADLIRDYTTPGFKLDPFTVGERVTQLWPDGAVLGGVVTLTGAEKGLRYAVRLRFADVWARRSGRWQLVYTQASPAPARR